MSFDELYSKYNYYNRILDKYTIDIKNYNNNYNKLVSVLNSLYTFLKVISLDFYNNNKMDKFFGSILNRVDTIENNIIDYFIIESTPIFNYQKESLPLSKINTKNNEDIITWIVNEARSRYMETEYHPIRSKNKEEVFKSLSMIDKCGDIADVVKLICLENNIECKTLCIYPGFNEKANLYNGYRFHYFNIITIRGKEYIVDLSYRQFFLLKLNLLNRIGVAGLGNSCPGSFMTLTKERLEVAKQILKNGYIKLNNPTGKCYFDGFSLSFRNGHFYEQTNDFSYTTFYTLDDYKKFLNGEDSQIEHESRNTLKLQTRPIQNPYLDFSYKGKYY